MFVFFSKLFNSYYLIVNEESVGKTSWMMFDEVSKLASKRIMYLV